MINKICIEINFYRAGKSVFCVFQTGFGWLCTQRLKLIFLFRVFTSFEANSHDQINMTELWLEYDRKIFTTNVNFGTWPKYPQWWTLTIENYWFFYNGKPSRLAFGLRNVVACNYILCFWFVYFTLDAVYRFKAGFIMVLIKSVKEKLNWQSQEMREIGNVAKRCILGLHPNAV